MAVLSGITRRHPEQHTAARREIRTLSFSCLSAQVANTPVLARARAFLPQLAASNDALLARAREDPSSVSIENPTGSHVAMDLGVGVFDVKGDAPSGVPVVEGEEWTKGESESDVSSESSDSSDEEEEDVQIKEASTTRKEKK